MQYYVMSWIHPCLIAQKDENKKVLYVQKQCTYQKINRKLRNIEYKFIRTKLNHS